MGKVQGFLCTAGDPVYMGAPGQVTQDIRSASSPVFRYTSVTRATLLQLSMCSIESNGEPLTVFVSGLLFLYLLIIW